MSVSRRQRPYSCARLRRAQAPTETAGDARQPKGRSRDRRRASRRERAAAGSSPAASARVHARCADRGDQGSAASCSQRRISRGRRSKSRIGSARRRRARSAVDRLRLTSGGAPERHLARRVNRRAPGAQQRPPSDAGRPSREQSRARAKRRRTSPPSARRKSSSAQRRCGPMRKRAFVRREGWASAVSSGSFLAPIQDML